MIKTTLHIDKLNILKSIVAILCLLIPILIIISKNPTSPLDHPPIIPSSNVDSANIYLDLPPQVDMLYDYSNQELLKKHSDVIAIVRIKTAGYTNFDLTSKRFLTWPATVGELEIITIEKGDLKPGETIAYERAGGYMTIENYEKSLESEELAHQEYLQQQTNKQGLTTEEKRTKYVCYYPTQNDKEIAINKVYKIYAINSTNKNKHYQLHNGAIEIIGNEYGLIEVE